MWEKKHNQKPRVKAQGSDMPMGQRPAEFFERKLNNQQFFKLFIVYVRSWTKVVGHIVSYQAESFDIRQILTSCSCLRIRKMCGTSLFENMFIMLTSQERLGQVFLEICFIIMTFRERLRQYRLEATSHKLDLSATSGQFC